jgi:hypothetical protein
MLPGGEAVGGALQRAGWPGNLTRTGHPATRVGLTTHIGANPTRAGDAPARVRFPAIRAPRG